ncbi:helix-turn-helix domain-containing protein [Streptomyces sp. p1417]|uniref:Helix-turn-helix domain-containing protein n=1 Tax=Streptomyces typhae TaxID=2681492 RepID=A0A6L6XAQ0_9ACTN|nr:helix-turn-helix transcriptional regulator [Streptomyces typhae]MVO90751.1 helix-turn-helix domain-containing protein [Streptomyces typhae]
MAGKAEQRCSSCRAVLSRFNTASRCGPCQRGAVPKVAPEFWASPAVKTAVRAWNLGVVVQLFRQHTGLSQVAVARLANIDQAEVSRLERGRKKIRDRRQFAQWSEALGMPTELMCPLPDVDQLPMPSESGTAGHLMLQDGPGQLLLPAGRSLPPTVIPALAEPAVPFHDNALRLSPSRSASAWSQMPLRALLAAYATVDGQRRHFVMDAREGGRGSEEGPVTIPAAYELDELTYGILWAVAGFEAGVLGDDTALQDVPRLPPQHSTGGDIWAASGGLTDASRMLLGSRACAEFILDRRAELADAPVFWTREQRGEDAATWLIFKHKHRYLQETAPRQAHDGVGRAFCVPRQEVAASPTYERVLLFLAISLMESYGVTTWLTDEPDLQRTEGFVLARGRRAAIANWVRTDSCPQTTLTAKTRTLRAFADVVGYAQTHTVIAGTMSVQRLAATADYLDLDRRWLVRRCGQLAAEGVTGLARPRSRHLSLDALGIACTYVATELRSDHCGWCP